MIANTIRLLWFGSAKAELNGISCENNTGLSLVDYQLFRPTLPHLNVFPWFSRLIGLLRCSRTIQLLASHLFYLLANYWPQKSSSSSNNPYLLEILRIFPTCSLDSWSHNFGFRSITSTVRSYKYQNVLKWS